MCLRCWIRLPERKVPSACLANNCAHYYCLSWTKALQYHHCFNWIKLFFQCFNFHLKFFQLLQHFKLFVQLNPRTCSDQLNLLFIQLIRLLFIQLIFKQQPVHLFLLLILLILKLWSQLLRQRPRHLRLQPRLSLQQRSLRDRCAMRCQPSPIIKRILHLCCWFHQLQQHLLQMPSRRTLELSFQPVHLRLRPKLSLQCQCRCLCLQPRIRTPLRILPKVPSQLLHL